MSLRTSRTGPAGLAVATLLVGLLVAATGPAAASPHRTHAVDVYKKEAWLALDGEYPDSERAATISCHDGDYALDGMWLVDAYETPNPDDGVAGDERDVRVEASYSDAADPERWNFRFANLGTGRAQLKLFVTCLNSRSGMGSGHRHDLVVTDRPPSTNVLLHELLPTRPMDPCQPDELAVAPGFDFTSSSAQLLRSWPSTASTGDENWFWQFDVPWWDIVEATFYLRCLAPRTLPAAGHVHALDLSWIKETGIDSSQLPAGDDVHYDLRAGPHRDAVVGALQLSPFGFGTTTYLGADARGRRRTFTFWTLAPDNISLGVLTLGHRTGRQLAP